MFYIFIAAIASFVLGVFFSVYIVLRFRRMPAAPGHNYRLTNDGWESVDDHAGASAAVPAAEATRPVEPVELDQLVAAGRKPKGLAAFEEKTRQVQEFEFADLLSVDHEEMVAEPVAADNEEQLEIAREDSRLLKVAIERSGPVAVIDARPGAGPGAHPGAGPGAHPGAGPGARPGAGLTPHAMLRVPQPSHYIYSSRPGGDGLMN